MAERWDSPCGRVTLYCGDALTLLPQLESVSVDFIFTDPPYGSFCSRWAGGKAAWKRTKEYHYA